MTQLGFAVPPTNVSITGVENPINGTQTPTDLTCTVLKVKPNNVTFKWTLHSKILDLEGRTNVTDHGDGTWKVEYQTEHVFKEVDNSHMLKCEVIHGVDSTKKGEDSKQVEVYCEQFSYFF